MCVRVTDMRGVDLSRYTFDYDLTFAALLMHPDGRIYHRYGGRDERGADTWLSIESLRAALEAGLSAHAAYEPSGEAQPHEPVRLEELPSFAKRDKGECIHCHSVHPAFYEEALAGGDWSDDDKWVYPAPARIGIDLDRDDQRRVRSVEAGSPAEEVGLRTGDRLLAVGGVQLATASDLMRALHEAEPTKQRLELAYEREGRRITAELDLDGEWKQGTPLSFSWRPFKWGFTPAPGFGGPQLRAAVLEELGLEPDQFAFRVTYLVTWGDNRRFGKAAAAAGVREGDVVLSVGERERFESVDHFHAWWRLTREVGQRVEVVVLRSGRRHKLELEVVR